MDPMTLAALAALAYLVTRNPQPYGEGSSSTVLTPGTYRVRFKAAKPQTNSLQDVWAIPNAAIGGVMPVRFESLTVDSADPSVWWFTGIGTYSGPPYSVGLLPGMTLQRL